MRKTTIIIRDGIGTTLLAKEIKASHKLCYGDYIGTAGFAKEIKYKTTIPKTIFVQKVVITYIEHKPKWFWQSTVLEENIQVFCQI